MDVVASHIERQPEPLPDEVGERVQALFARALSKDPRQRPQNGTEFADAIAAARNPESSVDAGTSTQRATPVPDEATFSVRRRPRPNAKAVPTAAMPVAENPPIAKKVSRTLKKLRRK